MHGPDGEITRIFRHHATLQLPSKSAMMDPHNIGKGVKAYAQGPHCGHLRPLAGVAGAGAGAGLPGPVLCRRTADRKSVV